MSDDRNRAKSREQYNDPAGDERNSTQHVGDEFALIRRVSHMFQASRPGTIVPNGDDAAVYAPRTGKAQIVCVDAMVEGVHFKRSTMRSFDIGYKALAINLSDIAAMGGTPTYFLISLAVTKQWTQSEIEEMYRGMRSLADQFGMELLGGDTVSAEKQLVISVTVIGEAEAGGQPLLRSQAEPGHLVFVTGPLGQSAAGLDLLLRQEQHKREGLSDSFVPLIQAHQRPVPHVSQGQLLAKLANRRSERGEAFALNDISDGLASEVAEIAEASNDVDIVLDGKDLPLSQELCRYAEERGKDPSEWALYGGEDFVLTGTFPVARKEDVQAAFAERGLPIYIIGSVEQGSGRVWLRENGEKHLLAQKGYNHFK